jgi:hypothetical protein
VLRMSSRSILKNELNRAILKRVGAAAGSVRINSCSFLPWRQLPPSLERY